MSTPSVTFMLQYTGANSGFVDYMNRSEAVDIDNELAVSKNEQMIDELSVDQLKKIRAEVPEQSLDFPDYIDYMNRSYATEKQTKDKTAVFNQEKNHLTTDEVDQLKNQLETAYQNGSLLWQGVLSFDNSFLAKQGLYDLETGQVDQAAIKNVLRTAMPHLIQREGLSSDAFWWGNIHLNTDNIHIHFGLSELESSREKIYYAPRGRMELRGNFSQKSIQGLKSEIFHGLLNDQTRSRLLRQEQVLANLKTDLLKNVLQDNQVATAAEKNFLEQAYNHLPQNKNWRFKSNAKDFATSKFFLNRYLDSYFENEGKEVYDNFIKETRTFLEEYRTAYSSDDHRSYERVRYVDGKPIKQTVSTAGYDMEKLLKRRENDLRERLGNAILKQFKEGVPRVGIAEGSQDMVSNLNHFSQSNQERLRKQLPSVQLVREATDWEKRGFTVPEGVKPLTILRPEYGSYDKHGTGIGPVTGFKTVEVYDVSQVKEDIVNKQLSLKDLSLLSQDDLKGLIDRAKKKEDPSDKERKELGSYRYALRLKGIEQEQTKLMVLSKLADQMTPLASDKPYLDFKKTEFNERLQLTKLQLTPNYRLSSAEKTEKEQLAQRYQGARQLPIKAASVKNIQPAYERLNQEIAVTQVVRDSSLLSVLKGTQISKADYLKDLTTQKSIFEVKHTIYQNNQQLKKLTDDNQIKALKIENSQHFRTLKELYGELAPREQLMKSSPLEKQVANTLHQEQVTKQANLQGNRGKMQATTSFMSGLSTVLSSAGRANTQALKARQRQKRREEEEERSQTL
ncbi:MobP2 family relaxase [Streptococcus anginosus]|uniref:MobP2 family relaxase n=1 Tax=Streptococcus anginosus TaxID=1328 RepID=UPI0021F8D726|nr:MobP2 family relaxase [Streptococcus anginosus]MCW0972331.1 relaxase MobL [Streptococcus anginosus]MCW1030772.1 relaxase MobL [Streptococcus anginosus]MCW1040364.1 relaxase MobL [Streptococcus anginosus]